ncbi:hypothetical protein EJ110_NYTH42730 [Nymphaea thermarum]|nr:hypothetical protein EJ110_NYTH42730 [Nymphaea thermarum]
MMFCPCEGLVAEGKGREAIKAHCEEGNLEEAKKVLQELKKKDMQPNRLAYEAIIPALCAAEDLNRASELCLEVLNGNRFISVEVLQDWKHEAANMAKKVEQLEISKRDTKMVNI